MTAFFSQQSGMCTACFLRYTAGTKVFVDPTGKVKHYACGSANQHKMVWKAPQGRIYS